MPDRTGTRRRRRPAPAGDVPGRGVPRSCPHYHDMGFVGQLLASLYCSGTVHLMSPTAFLKRPYPWLAMVSAVRARFTTSPNFARIVDSDTHEELPESRVGEIWVAGDSVADGYWGRPDATAATFGAGSAALHDVPGAVDGLVAGVAEPGDAAIGQVPDTHAPPVDHQLAANDATMSTGGRAQGAVAVAHGVAERYAVPALGRVQRAGEQAAHGGLGGSP